MNYEQSKHFQYLLQQKKEDHEGILEDIVEGGMEGYRYTEDTELSRYDNHPADVATEVYDAEHMQALRKNQEFAIREIDDALKRIQSNTYGICEQCGKEIPAERLEILPHTRSCIHCKQEEEHESQLDSMSKSLHRAVEEDVLEKVMRGHREEGRSEPYDGEQALEEVLSYGSSDSPQDGAPLGNRQDAVANGRDIHDVQTLDQISNEMYKRQIT